MYGSKAIDRLAYYFELDVSPDFDFAGAKYAEMVISSEEFKKYFYSKYQEFDDPDNDPNMGYLYTFRESRQFDLDGFGKINMALFKDGRGNYLNWWQKKSLKDDSYL